MFGYGVMTATLAALADLYRLPTQPLLGNGYLRCWDCGRHDARQHYLSCGALGQYIRLPAIFSFFEGRRSASLLIIPLAMGLGYVLAHVLGTLSAID